MRTLPQPQASLRPLRLKHRSLQAQALAAWYPAAGNVGLSVVQNRGAGLIGDAAFPAAAPSWVYDGECGYVLEFAAGNVQHLEISLATGSGYTISFWIFENGAENYGSLGTDASGYGLYYRGAGAGSDENKIVVYNDDVDALHSSTLPAGQWVLVTLVVSGGTMTFYIDGVADTSTSSHALDRTLIQIGTTQFGEDYGGLLHDYRYYSRPLSAAEVYQLRAPQTRWDLYQPARSGYVMRTGGAVGQSGAADTPEVSFTGLDAAGLPGAVARATEAPVLNWDATDAIGITGISGQASTPIVAWTALAASATGGFAATRMELSVEPLHDVSLSAEPLHRIALTAEPLHRIGLNVTEITD